jgi:prolyl-tRNA editing enzyme YbaK/EbsC (Cys-tRNA(Pro) deacylase)
LLGFLSFHQMHQSLVHNPSDYNHHQIPEATRNVMDAAKSARIFDFCRFVQVESDYYDWELEKRKDRLSAPSIDHLCKTLLFENTKYKPLPDQDPLDVLNPTHPKFVMVVIQYTDKMSTKKLNLYMRQLGGMVQSSKVFNMRIAPEEVAQKLTGFGKNGVSPMGIKSDLLVLVTEKISLLDPPLLFLGAGDVDWKIGLLLDSLLKATKSAVVDLSE